MKLLTTILVFVSYSAFAGLIPAPANLNPDIDSLLKVGQKHFAEGHHDSAAYVLTAAESACVRDGLTYELGTVCAWIGNNYQEQNMFGRAEEYYGQSLNLLSQYDNHRATNLSKMYLAALYGKQGQHREALKLYDELEVFFSRDSSLLLGLMNNKGEGYLKMGQPEAAKHTLLNAQGLAVRLNDSLRQAHIHSNLGQSYERTGQLELAVHHYTESLGLYASLGLSGRETDCFQSLLSLFQKQGNREGAKALFELYLTRFKGLPEENIEYYQAILTDELTGSRNGWMYGFLVVSIIALLLAYAIKAKPRFLFTQNNLVVTSLPEELPEDISSEVAYTLLARQAVTNYCQDLFKGAHNPLGRLTDQLKGLEKNKGSIEKVTKQPRSPSIADQK